LNNYEKDNITQPAERREGEEAKKEKKSEKLSEKSISIFRRKGFVTLMTFNFN
jgi:hypothetical protein